MTQQELFNCATGNYQSARALVSKMNEVVAAATTGYNPRAAFVKLDIIIQYTLLEVALADGKFSPIEGEFIDKITDTFDVLNLFNNYPQDKNWRWFATNRSFSEIRDTIGRLRGMAQQHMMEFASLFAIVDKAYPNYNILEELLEYLAKIAGCFTHIDGSHEQREVDIASKVTSEYLIRPWLSMMGK